jgi:formate--tetrahydrofolate ligase
MNMSEYVVTEAGFGSDLGAEKFLDIVCDVAKIVPNCVVLVVSTRSLKMHGGVLKDELNIANTKALLNGIKNLEQHIKNISAFNIPFIISITQLDISIKEEILLLIKWLEKNKIEYSLNDTFTNGGAGGKELAKKVVNICAKTNTKKFLPVYDKSETLELKIEKICNRCYGASGVLYSDEAKKKLILFAKMNKYVCIAKTPISLTDDEKKLVINEPFKIHINDIILANGADFLIVITGNIFRMPGLPKIPEANNM